MATKLCDMQRVVEVKASKFEKVSAYKRKRGYNGELLSAVKWNTCVNSCSGHLRKLKR